MSLEDFEDIDFEIEREVWNVYELTDGSILRIRAVLTNILRILSTPTETTVKEPRPTKGDEYQIGFQNITSIKVNPKLLGTPTDKKLTPKEIDEAPKIEVGFKPISEDWNVYRMTDGNKIRIKLVVASVLRLIDKYDEMGIPVYYVNSTNVIAPIQRKLP